mgnify:CR=1 FL=1
MNKLLLFCLIFSVFSSYAQTVLSNCNAPDSIVKKYKDDADKLAINRVFHINSTYKDSIEINKPIRNNYLKALLAVYNATNLPARDTVIDIFNIHNLFGQVLKSIIVHADTGLFWMKNIRDND